MAKPALLKMKKASLLPNPAQTNPKSFETKPDIIHLRPKTEKKIRMMWMLLLPH